MIQYSSGTVFNLDVDAIVNTVNCEGVMGAGIALEFKLRYPEMYADYVAKCKKNQIRTGCVDYYKVNKRLTIVNFPTKFLFKRPSKIQWIEEGLEHFASTFAQHGIKSIAFPKLGTNKGGLNWEEVKPLMENYLNDLPIDIYICLDELEKAQGVEKKMIDLFNKESLDDISKNIRLTSKQKDALNNARPAKRFWKISRIQGIGTRTYESLFKRYYEKAINGEEETEQLSMEQLLNV